MARRISPDEHTETVKLSLRDRFRPLAGVVRSARDWASANRLKAVLLACAGLVSVAVAAGLFFILLAAQAERPEAELQAALAALDSGDHQKAERLALALRQRSRLPADTLAGTAYVLGAVAARRADEAWSRDARRYHQAATRYLEEARDRGFPPGRDTEATLLLGYSLFRSGRYAAARPVLQEVLSRAPERETEIRHLLAEACLRDADPKPDEALEHNTRYLADLSLTPDGRHEGVLQRARILLRMKRLQECLTVLDRIPKGACNEADAIVIRGRVLIEQARALRRHEDRNPETLADVQDKYHEAMGVLRKAAGRVTLASDAGAHVDYLTGVCLAELGDERAALAQFAQVAKKHADTAEAFAASCGAARLLRTMGRDLDAVAVYGRVIRGVGDPQTFANPWLTATELRGEIFAAVQQFRDGEQYDVALSLVQQIQPLFGPAETLELKAEIHRSWGRSLLGKAGHLPPSQAEPLRRSGREQLRRAGSAYSALAQIRIATRSFSDDLWASAETYFQGHNFTAASKVLRRYLRDQMGPRRPRALLCLGQAMMALGQYEEAIEQFRRCFQYHARDPASFLARLSASAAQRELGRFEQATALLVENLEGEYLTPASVEWRDSKFALGRLLHAAGRFDDAIVHLEEAATRYPDDPQTVEARYLLGDSFRRTARQIEQELEAEVVLSARVALRRRMRDSLTSALEQFRQTKGILDGRQQRIELTEWEQSTLRDCFFFIGDLEFDLGQFEAAIGAYTAAVDRYQAIPQVLEAYVQMARAYAALGKPDEARSTVEQARAVLNRIESAEEIATKTIYTQEEWSEVLDRMSRTVG